ncbi:MAG: alpha/beta fold hydrolase [Saprospirales bacterium]|nr:alpha/beta fold hydrolase [Saprospirales bacterium]
MQLFFREFGQGSPVVILHGLFGFSDNWQTIAKALASHHLVITPDLRNHGRSPHLPTHSYPEMADDLKAFLEQHWIFKTSLIGHSMGGKVAMHYALHHPDMVDKLVVIDIAPGPADDNHSAIFRSLLDLDLSQIHSRQEAEDVLKTRIPDAGVRQFLLKNITRHADGAYSWKMNLPVLWNTYPDILAGVSGDPFDKPTLFVRGSRSDYIKDSDFTFIKSLFPQAEIATIEGAGHWVHADQPGALLATVRTFLG